MTRSLHMIPKLPPCSAYHQLLKEQGIKALYVMMCLLEVSKVVNRVDFLISLYLKVIV